MAYPLKRRKLAAEDGPSEGCKPRNDCDKPARLASSTRQHLDEMHARIQQQPYVPGSDAPIDMAEARRQLFRRQLLSTASSEDTGSLESPSVSADPSIPVVTVAVVLEADGATVPVSTYPIVTPAVTTAPTNTTASAINALTDALTAIGLAALDTGFVSDSLSPTNTANLVPAAVTGPAETGLLNISSIPSISETVQTATNLVATSDTAWSSTLPLTTAPIPLQLGSNSTINGFVSSYLTYPTNLVPAIVAETTSTEASSATNAPTAQDTAIMTTSPDAAIVTSQASSPLNATLTSDNASHTFLLNALVTSLPNGQSLTITQSRSAALTTLSNGQLSVSLGGLISPTAIVTGSRFATDSAAGTKSTPTVFGHSTGYGVGSSSDSAPLTSTDESSSGSQSGSLTTTQTSELAGGIVGGLAGAAALLVVALLFLRWYRRQNTPAEIASTSYPTSPTTPVTPIGRGMAERTGLLHVAAMVRGNNRSTPLASAPEPSFQRIAGRKLPSVFSPGMTSADIVQARNISRPKAVPGPAVFEHQPSRYSASTASEISRVGEFLRSPHHDQTHFPTRPPGQAKLRPTDPYRFGSPISPPDSPSATLLEGRSSTPEIYFMPHGRFSEDV